MGQISDRYRKELQALGDGYNISAVSKHLTLQENKPKMAVYNINFTVEVFKKLDDGNQIKVQRFLGATSNIVAGSLQAAIAVAARKLPEIDDELLGAVLVTVQVVA